MRSASKRFDDGLKCFRVLLAGIILVLIAVIANAQQTSTAGKSPSANAESHRIHALRITEPIKIDGLLNEPVWATAEPATDFRQESPGSC